MASIKDLEGSFSVNGDVTPITHQPIQKVDADKWSEMTLSELHEQKTVLDSRLLQAIQCDHPEMVTQIHRGIEILIQLIGSKAGETSGLIR